MALLLVSPLSRYQTKLLSQPVVWQLEGQELHCVEGPEQLQGSKVTVIGEELAYNKAMQPFRLLVIDQPLDQSHQVQPVLLVCGRDSPPLPSPTASSGSSCSTSTQTGTLQDSQIF